MIHSIIQCVLRYGTVQSYVRLFIRCAICKSASETLYAEGNKRKLIIKITVKKTCLSILSRVGTYAMEKALSTTYIFQTIPGKKCLGIRLHIRKRFTMTFTAS
jgi:hypothetical protein